MISTRILLLLAALALACIAGDESMVKKDCPPVTQESFESFKKETRPHNFFSGLGQYCEARNRFNGQDERCIGYNVKEVPGCTLCCACLNGTGSIYYNKTVLPKSFRCQSSRRNQH
uniref:Putative salivary secreted protein n=1 Tax=Ixodes ricinus TaxID=34613 RepID=A0A090X861_IXORI